MIENEPAANIGVSTPVERRVFLLALASVLRCRTFALYCTVLYNPCMTRKEAVSFRLSPEAVQIIRDLAKKLGVSQADVVEMAVRKLEKHERDQ